MQRRWGRVFAIASLVTPILLGVAVGGVASGATQPQPRAVGFFAGYVAFWLTSFAFAVGLFTLACFAFLAAVYLTLEAQDTALRDDFRARALGAGVAVFVTAALGLLLARPAAPLMQHGLLASGWALPFQLATGAFAVTAFVALWRRSHLVARLAAAAQVSLILWGWAWSQFPYILPPDLTIADAAAPVATLHLVLGTLAIGAAVLLPSLAYLFRVFKRSAGS